MRKSSDRSQRYRPGTSRGSGSPTTFREQMTDFARGDRLLELRAERGMSREDLAHELGVTTKTVYSWEKQSGPIKTANAKRVAEFYGVDDWQALVTRDKGATGPSSRGQVGEGFDEFRQHVGEIRTDIAELKLMLEQARTERQAIRALLKEQEDILNEMRRVAGSFPDDEALRLLNEGARQIAEAAEAYEAAPAEKSAARAGTRRRRAAGQ